MQAFAPDDAGARIAFQAVSSAMVHRRAKMRQGEQFEALDYFEGKKDAEDDRSGRS